jgi:L-ascorbate metabolism protein UlaG (beta-lactamase superfamily)
VGHNTVAVRSARSCVVVDPWFFPRARRYGRAGQPLQPRDLGPIDAVLVTHSHPDHFDPGSLLMLGRATRVIVPRVSRESLLALDLKARLRELGFTAVTELAWWKTARVGDIDIVALPFHGEQPTAGRRLYPDARNWGNCYLVKTPGLSCAFVADAGADAEGRVGDVALQAYERHGAIDVLFSGYRGWSLYPVQFFGSSVRHYLLFVPPELYSVRQTIMSTADDAVNTAEAWHARYLAPYADGGAPWYAEVGLGPGESAADAWLSFDPPREHCVTALSARSQPVPGLTVGSAVRPLLLEPGDAFTLVRGTAVVKPAERRRGAGPRA